MTRRTKSRTAGIAILAGALALSAVASAATAARAGDEKPPAAPAAPEKGADKSGGTTPSEGTAKSETADAADAATPGGIQWFGTWTAGVREAKRTGRPILLVAAAPQCHGISGLW